MSELAAVLPIKAKGDRPHFFEEPAVDKLLAMVLALAGELSVESDRNDSLVRLLEEKGVLSAEELKAFSPSEAVMAEREERRQEILESLFRIVLQEVEGLEKGQEA